MMLFMIVDDLRLPLSLVLPCMSNHTLNGTTLSLRQDYLHHVIEAESPKKGVSNKTSPQIIRKRISNVLLIKIHVAQSSCI
jgi:hypothetical protein